MSVFDLLTDEPILPAVVLPKPEAHEKTAEREARESTNSAEVALPVAPAIPKVDSCGGQNTLSGGTNEAEGQRPTDLASNAIVSASEVKLTPSETAAPPAQSSLATTLDQVVAFLRRYIVFPMPEQFDLVALWIAHTYVYDLFHWTPYLIVRSPEAECGKSTVLGAIKLLARAPWKVVVPTPAVIYRKIERDRPTVIIDEYDTIYNEKIKSEANEILRGTLNAGFERGDVIPRCDGPKNELLEFSPYCPKALAGIGRLPETVESRAFIIPIVRLGHSEFVEEYDEEIAPEEARPIAEALKVWAVGSRNALRKANPSRPPELKPRQRNIAKPLLAIADLAGGEWPDRAREALVRTCAKEKLISQGTQLLDDIRSIILTASVDKMTTNELLERLVRVESANSPWPVWWEGDLKAGKTHGPGKKLASLLAAFDIHPRPLRWGPDVKKGYSKADFVGAWDRYLEPAVAETAEFDLEL